MLFRCEICFGLWENCELSCDTKVSENLEKVEKMGLGTFNILLNAYFCIFFPYYFILKLVDSFCLLSIIFFKKIHILSQNIRLSKSHIFRVYGQKMIFSKFQGLFTAPPPFDHPTHTLNLFKLLIRQWSFSIV